jgi:MFS transporter, ACS family, tartrate transporter
MLGSHGTTTSSPEEARMVTDVEHATIRKLMWRLVAFSGLLYFFNWLDRVNVGFAALRMNQDLGFSATIYGIAAGLFFVGFALFEIPSNLVLHRVGARRWIARIMISWGIICAAMAVVQGVTSFYVLRFLLGAAEAGFTPGLALYFSLWFPRRHRAKAFALWFASPLLAPVIGGPLSGWLLTVTHGWFGLVGWRWMFLLEGLPSVLLGLVILAWLPDRPARAAWLTDAERAWLVDTLEAEARAAPPVTHDSIMQFIADRRLWALVAVYFFWSMSSYAIVLWLPLIIKSVAANLTPVQVGFVNSVPFLFAIAGLVLVGRRSDRTGDRKRPIMLFAVLTFLCLVATATVGSPLLGLLLVCASAFCIWAQQAVFWTLPSAYLGGRSAAGGLALVNMGAAVGGFVGPPAIGIIRDATGSYAPGLIGLGVSSLIVAAIVAAMRIEGTAPELPADIQLEA